MFLVARPEDKALVTCQAFEEHGITAIAAPVINIETIVDDALSKHFDIFKPEIILVTSTYASEWLNSQLIDSSVLCIGCVGEKTKQALTLVDPDLKIFVAEPENSEGLLHSKSLKHVEGRKIALIKGLGGRTLISESLRKKGAFVEEFCVYKRQSSTQASHFPKVLKAFEHDQIRCIIATSIDVVQALYRVFNGQKLSNSNILWIVPSKRIGQYLWDKGIHSVTISKGASISALLAAAISVKASGVLHD